MIASICAGVLIFYQILDFNKERVIKSWEVDYHKTTDVISVHLDMILPNAPCRILSVDVLDFVGSEFHDVKLHHIRIDKDGKYEGHTSGHGIDKKKKFELSELIKEVEQWPGCQINGNFPIRKAPGNFHVSFHSYFQFYDYLANKSGMKINLEHKIHSLRLELSDNKSHHMDNHSFKLYRHKYDRSFYQMANAAVRTTAVEKKGKFIAEHF